MSKGTHRCRGYSDATALSTVVYTPRVLQTYARARACKVYFARYIGVGQPSRDPNGRADRPAERDANARAIVVVVVVVRRRRPVPPGRRTIDFSPRSLRRRATITRTRARTPLPNNPTRTYNSVVAYDPRGYNLPPPGRRRRINRNPRGPVREVCGQAASRV